MIKSRYKPDASLFIYTITKEKAETIKWERNTCHRFETLINREATIHSTYTETIFFFTRSKETPEKFASSPVHIRERKKYWGAPHHLDGSNLLRDDVEGVEDAGDEPQEGEQQADPELNPASELEEDAEGREDDGDDDLDAGGRAHGRSPFLALMNRWVDQ